MQKKINDTIAKNKELYEINPPVSEINPHCDYVSYCLGVSLFWRDFILDIKYFFLLSSLLILFTFLYIHAQMSPFRELTLTALFENCFLPSIFDNPHPPFLFVFCFSCECV